MNMNSKQLLLNNAFSCSRYVFVCEAAVCFWGGCWLTSLLFVQRIPLRSGEVPSGHTHTHTHTHTHDTLTWERESVDVRSCCIRQLQYNMPVWISLFSCTLSNSLRFNSYRRPWTVWPHLCVCVSVVTILEFLTLIQYLEKYLKNLPFSTPLEKKSHKIKGIRFYWKINITRWVKIITKFDVGWTMPCLKVWNKSWSLKITHKIF